MSIAISAIILSGGQSTRMGGVDKGLLNFQNQPLVQHVINRLTPQVGQILINANRELPQYEAFNLPVIEDDNHEFLGPLAGFKVGLKKAKHDYVLTVPCDSPLLPYDLVSRLKHALDTEHADIAVAKCNGKNHPVFSLMKKSVLPSLIAFLDKGERKVNAWQKSQAYVEVDFTDSEEAFANLNTKEDLAALEKIAQTKQTAPSLAELVHNPDCMDDYDPNAMSVTQARQFIQQYLEPMTAKETRPIRETLGSILAADITSPHNVPNHDNSAMDGYAFNHADAEKSLKVIGTAFAGQPFDGDVQAGECIKIMTGAVVPTTIDTVVMQEHVDAKENHITISKIPQQGANIRKAGEDIQAGQTVLAKGRCIRAADLGLLASLGVAEVSVFKPLKVAFFSTGDELVGVGEPLEEGQIYDSNRYTLFGMLSQLGCDITDLGAIPDDPAQLETTLLNASQTNDAVITSGGVSVGEADHMKALLKQHGQVLFWKINMKPGRPLAYGKVGNAHYFGLPGNPVATMVSFYQFVRQALQTLMGARVKEIPMFNVTCTEAIRKHTGRTEFQRGVLFLADGEWKVKPLPNQSSGVLSSMSQANCFIVLGETVGDCQAGDTVQVQVFNGVI